MRGRIKRGFRLGILDNGNVDGRRRAGAVHCVGHGEQTELLTGNGKKETKTRSWVSTPLSRADEDGLGVRLSQ